MGKLPTIVVGGSALFGEDKPRVRNFTPVDKRTEKKLLAQGLEMAAGDNSDEPSGVHNRSLSSVSGVPVGVGGPPQEPRVSISQLQVPLFVMATIIVFMVGGLLSVAGAWWKLSAHASDSIIHADPAKVVERRGLAYKEDVSELSRSTEKQIDATRDLFRKMVLTCTKKGADLVCTNDTNGNSH